MVGGGPHLSPGEITLADQGVLFLDELPEFGRDVLEALRQPMEEGRVAIARAGRATMFPARFQLVAAMNPCPCGFAGRPTRRAAVPRASPSDTSDACPARSATGSTCGSRCRASRRWRSSAGRIRRGRPRSRRGSRPPGRSAARRPPGLLNARLTGRLLRAACQLSRAAERSVVHLAELERASGRGTERLLRVARTIADLAGEPAVREHHLDEAAWFRPADLRLAAAEAS